MKNKICILGLGWLGQPLADLYASKQWNIFGSTRKSDKQQRFAKLGYETKLFDIYTSPTTALPAHFFKDACLVINIPPGRKNLNVQSFEANIKALITHAFKHALHQLIFVSTTSVFGNKLGLITNQTEVAPITDSAKAHVAIESFVKEKYWQKSVIIRPSGLVGGNRHPALNLSARSDIPLGKNPINLIHQTDVIKVIETIIEANFSSQCFNLSTLDHPCREEYYTWCCNKLGIRPPHFCFDERQGSQIDGKIIDMQTELSRLKLSMTYQSAFDFPLPNKS